LNEPDTATNSSTATTPRMISPEVSRCGASSGRWIDRIAAELARMAKLAGRKALQAMYDSNLANIGLCEEQLG
jgi:hypothetical protein